MISVHMCEIRGHNIKYSKEWDSWYCEQCNQWCGGSTWNTDRPERPNE